MKASYVVFWTALLWGFFCGSAQAERAFYVSPQGDDAAGGTTLEKPVRTVAKALDLVRQAPKDASITVYLRGGPYPLTAPLVLTPEHSGTAEHPVIIKPYENESPLITGGRRVTGWTKHDDNLWKTQLDDVKAGQWYFTQLFVNGRRCPRARIPNEGFFRVAGFPDGGREINYHTDCQRFEYRPGDIDPNWTNLDDVEVIVYNFWTDSHLPIESLDTEKHIVTFKHKAGKVFTDDFTDNGARYVAENVFEGLTQPGQWYLNRKIGVLYYWPTANENMETAEVIAPVAPALLSIEGLPMERRYVEHLRFEGVRFAHTHWFLPPGNSNDDQGSSSVPAAVTLKGARFVAFDRCEFSRLGTFAIEVLDGSAHNQFTRNVITDIAAGGFRVNGGNESSPPLLHTGDNVIADNRIGPYGQVYPSAVGILLMHTFGNTVAHNEIHHGYYTGISVGWHWGYQRSISRDNRIEYNHIHHIGQGLLSDMGGIYTLGVSPGTVLRGNLIHDIDANQYGGWGIYNDEGSSHILIENNIVYDTKFAGYNIHYAKELTVRNNIFALGRLQQLSRGIIEPHKSCFFENNIVYFEEGTLLDNQWSDNPYDFYYRPGSGVQKTDSTFDMDWNVYFNPKQSVEDVRFNGKTFQDWKKTGKDTHSVYADPLFVDVAKRDFRLRPDSPALKLGFQSIDLSTAGPREKLPAKD